MAKIQLWNPREARKILKQRLVDSMEDRRHLEYRVGLGTTEGGFAESWAWIKR